MPPDPPTVARQPATGPRLPLLVRLVTYLLAWLIALLVAVGIHDALEAAGGPPVLAVAVGAAVGIGAAVAVTRVWRHHLDRQSWSGIGLPPLHRGAGQLAVGFILGLASLTPVWKAILLTSALFVALHAGLVAELGVGVVLTGLAIGAVFVVGRLVTGALWLPIGLHWGWNWAGSHVFGTAGAEGVAAHLEVTALRFLSARCHSTRAACSTCSSCWACLRCCSAGVAAGAGPSGGQHG
jgi:hypothetical protein